VSQNIVKTTPKEGVAAIPYDLCITHGSKNAELARKYINLTLTKPVQEQLVGALYGTPSRTDLTLAPELKKLVSLDPAQLFFQDEEYAASKQREWLDRYTREVQS
jgi:ABC-type Fe3+ transport system substrate-binding protein